MNGYRSWRLLGWMGLLLAAAVVLYTAGSGVLATPSPSAPAAQWAQWLHHTDALVVAFALLRALALAFTCYAAAVTVAGTMARVAGARLLAGYIDRLTLPLLRRALAAGLSMSVVTGGVGAATSAPVVAAEGTYDTSTTVPASGDESDPGPPPTLRMQRLPDGLAAEPQVLPAAGEWWVEPGQCFWYIAETVLTASWGRVPSDAEIVPYWSDLIEANRAALADPDNPDLIFPSQVFTIPVPPSSSR